MIKEIKKVGLALIVSNNLYKRLIADMSVNIRITDYTACWREWKNIDYTPDYNKLYYICDGEGWLNVGGLDIYPTPGQLVLMPCGIKQSFSAINDNPFKKYWCEFDAKIGEANLFDIVRCGYCVDVTDKPYLDSLFETVISTYRKDDLACQIKAKSAMLGILAYFLEHTGNLSIEKSNTTWSKTMWVLDYIETHICENIRVEQLANLVHLHPNYFIKFFKAQTGVSPIQYINNTRLEKAKKLLLFSDYNITEIANETGFNDIVHFSKLFKQHTGFSPSEFKKLKTDAY